MTNVPPSARLTDAEIASLTKDAPTPFYLKHHLWAVEEAASEKAYRAGANLAVKCDAGEKTALGCFEHGTSIPHKVCHGTGEYRPTALEVAQVADEFIQMLIVMVRTSYVNAGEADVAAKAGHTKYQAWQTILASVREAGK